MLCYCGCGNEVFDIQIDPRDQKIMACEVCQRAMKECYMGLLSADERADIVLIEDVFNTEVTEIHGDSKTVQE